MFDHLISDAQRRDKTFTIYSDDPDMDILDRLSNQGVVVRHRRLPTGQAPFVTIHDDGEYLGALQLSDLAELLTPPVVCPGSRETLSPPYRALYEMLENTVFTALDRRQLLGASREIEDRAFRVGHGTLRVSFESKAALDAQTETYRYLADNTALDVHIYGDTAWDFPAIDGVIVHESADTAIEKFWSLGFDGGGDEMQACGLVARADNGEFTGFWTYDPDTVGEILSVLEAVD